MNEHRPRTTVLGGILHSMLVLIRFIDEKFRFLARTVLLTRKDYRWLAVGVLSFIAITVSLSLLRHVLFRTNAWDLGIYMQALWTTSSEGRFLYYTAELSWNDSGSLFGVHFVPILFALVPVYWAFPGALTLFVIQSAAVGASAIPLHLLLLRRTTPSSATALTLCYLVSPTLLGALLYDFHVEAFIPLTGLATWLAWETRRYRLLAIAATSLLAVIEFSPIILGAIALMFLLKGVRSFRTADRGHTGGSRLTGLGFPALVFSVSVVLTFVFFWIPKLVSPSTPPFVQVGPLGGSLSEILSNLTNPGLVAEALSANWTAKAAYILGLLATGLALWVIKPLDALPALPWIMVVLLTATSVYTHPSWFQYGFLTIPFIFPATASAIESLRARLRRARTRGPALGGARQTQFERDPPIRMRVRNGAPEKWITVPLALLFVVGQLVLSPLSPNNGATSGLGDLPGPHHAAIQNVLALVPDGASISAQPDIFPHVANRLEAYPYFKAGVEYVIFDISSGWLNGPFPPPSPISPWIVQLREGTSGAYGLLASADGVSLLRRAYQGDPVVFSPFRAARDVSSFVLLRANLVVDGSSPMGSYLTPDAVSTREVLWGGPYLLLPPGVFQLRFLLRASSTSSGPIRFAATMDFGETLLATEIVNQSEVASDWSLRIWFMEITHPGFFELIAISQEVPSGIQFGGFELLQIRAPVTLG